MKTIQSLYVVDIRPRDERVMCHTASRWAADAGIPEAQPSVPSGWRIITIDGEPAARVWVPMWATGARTETRPLTAEELRLPIVREVEEDVPGCAPYGERYFGLKPVRAGDSPIFWAERYGGDLSGYFRTER